MPDYREGTQPVAVVASAGAALAGLAFVTLRAVMKPASRKVLPSPRKTLLPHLSRAQVSRLAYPPDVLPGARDVETPYGSMRVYEWGPITGRKVLFVHGDATPSPMFKPIADEIVTKGCRVMMFDLWGRGYTDTPADSPHDCRLYSSQIYFALTSSPIAWTGDGERRFSLIGFSMGGSIVLDFFARHPSLIEGIVLLGPGGLIRNLPAEYTSPWFKVPAAVPEAGMRRLIGTLLGVTVGPVKTAIDAEPSEHGFTPAGALQFQYDYHPGHVQSFLSTIRNGPLQHQEAIWESAGSVIREAGFNGRQGKAGTVLNTILVICGADDPVVPPKDVEDDLLKYLHRKEHFRFETVPGGHGFPWSEGKPIATSIIDFWGLDGSAKDQGRATKGEERGRL